MDDLIISKYPDVIHIRAVAPLAGLTVRVTFSDDTQRAINLEPYLKGPAFEPIRNNPEMFRGVFIEYGALTWSNGADIDTDTLYYDGPPPWAKEAENAQAQDYAGEKEFARG